MMSYNNTGYVPIIWDKNNVKPDFPTDEDCAQIMNKYPSTDSSGLKLEFHQMIETSTQLSQGHADRGPEPLLAVSPYGSNESIHGNNQGSIYNNNDNSEVPVSNEGWGPMLSPDHDEAVNQNNLCNSEIQNNADNELHQRRENNRRNSRAYLSRKKDLLESSKAEMETLRAIVEKQENEVICNDNILCFAVNYILIPCLNNNSNIQLNISREHVEEMCQEFPRDKARIMEDINRSKQQDEDFQLKQMNNEEASKELEQAEMDYENRKVLAQVGKFENGKLKYLTETTYGTRLHRQNKEQAIFENLYKTAVLKYEKQQHIQHFTMLSKYWETVAPVVRTILEKEYNFCYNQIPHEHLDQFRQLYSFIFNPG